MTHGPHRWRKSSYSSTGTNCVELADGMTHVRDSKNATGPALHVHTAALIAAVKAGHLVEQRPLG